MPYSDSTINCWFAASAWSSSGVSAALVASDSSATAGEYFLILDDNVELKMSRHYKDRIKYFVPEV